MIHKILQNEMLKYLEIHNLDFIKSLLLACRPNMKGNVHYMYKSKYVYSAGKWLLQNLDVHRLIVSNFIDDIDVFLLNDWNATIAKCICCECPIT